jgi:hypothetical protein
LGSLLLRQTAVILERDLDAPHTVTLDLHEDSGLTARRPPCGHPSARVGEPWVGEAAIELQPLEVESGRDRARVTVPAHALVGVRFEGA